MVKTLMFKQSSLQTDYSSNAPTKQILKKITSTSFSKKATEDSNTRATSSQPEDKYLVLHLPNPFFQPDECIAKIEQENLHKGDHTSNAQKVKQLQSCDEDEFVNEIPGGFDEVQSFDQSSTRDDTDEIYVPCPKFDLYIGEDWSDVEVSSDVEENRVFEKDGYQNCLQRCCQCGKEFSNQIDFNAHELCHQNEVLFQCHFKNCQSGYRKASMLKSHLRKRHPEYWLQVSDVLDNKKILAQELLKPSDWMYDAIEKIRKEVAKDHKQLSI